jgi:uncharacterized phiE125 gp8 family phage protein
MIEGEALVLPPEAAGAAKGYLRVERADEDGLIGGLAEAAAELCEGFTGQVLIERGFAETIAAGRAWKRLGRAPVTAIAEVEAIAADGGSEPLSAGAYATEVDAHGEGWVRLTGPGGERRIRIRYRAGIAGDWPALPAALRHGIVRLAAFFYTSRVPEGGRSAGPPPAAVTALWRPYRRIRLS